MESSGQDGKGLSSRTLSPRRHGALAYPSPTHLLHGDAAQGCKSFQAHFRDGVQVPVPLPEQRLASCPTSGMAFRSQPTSGAAFGFRSHFRGSTRLPVPLPGQRSASGPTSGAALGSHVAEKHLRRCQGLPLGGATSGPGAPRAGTSCFVPSSSWRGMKGAEGGASGVPHPRSGSSLCGMTAGRTHGTRSAATGWAPGSCCGRSRSLKTVFAKMRFHSRRVPEGLKFFSILAVLCAHSFLFDAVSRRDTKNNKPVYRRLWAHVLPECVRLGDRPRDGAGPTGAAVGASGGFAAARALRSPSSRAVVHTRARRTRTNTALLAVRLLTSGHVTAPSEPGLRFRFCSSRSGLPAGARLSCSSFS